MANEEFKARLSLMYNLQHELLEEGKDYIMLPFVPYTDTDDLDKSYELYEKKRRFGSIQHLKDWCRDHIDFIYTNQMFFAQCLLDVDVEFESVRVIEILNYMTIEEVVAITGNRLE